MPRILHCIGGVIVRRSIPAQTCLLRVSSVTALGLLVASSAIAQELSTDSPDARSSHHRELVEQPLSEDLLAEQPPADGEFDITIAKESLRLTPLFRVGANTESGGTPASLTAFDGFFPLYQSPGDNVTFMNTRLNFDFEANNSLGGTLLFGHRRYSSDRERILGGYLSLDIRDTTEATFPQIGFGFERLGNYWDIRANGYVPVGDTRQRVDRDLFSSSQSTSSFGDVTFSGNQLISPLTTTTTETFQQLDRFEAALGGFDVEAGTRLARWKEHGEFRLYGGVYYLGGHDVSAVGGRGRIEIAPVKSVRLMAGVQGDPVFDVRGFVGVSFLFPTPGPLQKDVDPDEREAAIAALGETVTRLADPVARTFNVVVDEQQEVETWTTTTVTTEDVPLVNPATGETWRFTHVAAGGSSDGTFEDPFGTVQEGLDATVGDGNDIVYVSANGTEIVLEPFAIPDNVRVFSDGPLQEIETAQLGTVQLPGSGTGVLPVVLGTVTRGNNTELSGFIEQVSTFNFVFDNTFDNTLTEPFVGSGFLRFDGFANVGSFALDSLSGLQLSFTLDTGDTFTEADIITDLSTSGINIFDTGNGDLGLVFTGVGGGIFNGSLELTSGPRTLGFEPTPDISDPNGTQGGNGVINRYLLFSTDPPRLPPVLDGSYRALEE